MIVNRATIPVGVDEYTTASEVCSSLGRGIGISATPLPLLRMKAPQSMHRFNLLLCVFLLPGILHAVPPNVVVFLTDDQGWGDLGIHGNTNLATPNIDQLARAGTRLSNFYVCQVCAPTRAEFLTGRYYPRTGVSGVSRGEGRLNYDETTLADYLKLAGYATGCFGKWHNGTQPPYHPNNRGFDEFYGFTSGHWGHYFSPPLDHNGKRVRGNGFVVDDFTDHALKFIAENQERPFFCYLPYNTPHSPMMVPDHFYEKFADWKPGLRHRDASKEDLMMTRAALGLCENIDWNVGRVLKQLDDLELSRKTIVIYFSDNGPNSWRWNGGMKGRKGSLDEGGLRSPCFIRWPGRVSAGLNSEQIAGAIDLLPTVLQLTGADKYPQVEAHMSQARGTHPVDGRSLQPLLTTGDVEWPPRVLYSIKGKQVSVRSQQFRLDPAGALFDVQTDRRQKHNVVNDYPDVAKRLSQLAKSHESQMRAFFQQNSDRPFTVGYGPSTTLTARDGVPHGGIQRSSKAPNNSFFKEWTSEEDSITWNVDVGAAGSYEAILHYTCAEGDQDVRIRIGVDDGDFTEAVVKQVFDPPLYDKSKERVEKSHYFVKDFRPLNLGRLRLKQGRGTLRLSATGIRGRGVVDVHSIDLIQK